MNLFEILRGWDVAVFHWINALAGRWYWLDLGLAYQEDNNLLKGAVFIAGLVWYWFRPADDLEHRRTVIVNTMVAVPVALLVNRVISFLLPFRARPLYDASVPFIDPHVDVVVHFNLEHWSSFPSDTATYFFVMVGGLALISRRAGLWFGLYALAFIVGTRIVLGLHYPSDIVVGAVLGFTTTLVLNALLQRRLARRLLALERWRPHLFHAFSFLVFFEVAAMLEDIRHLPHDVALAAWREAQARLQAHRSLAMIGLLCFAALLLLTLIIARHRAHLAKHPSRNLPSG